MRKISRQLQLALIIFVISFLFHLIGLGKIGRTWDEQFKYDLGFVGWDNIFHGRFAEEYWAFGTEHPMLAKYIYGMAAPLNQIFVPPSGVLPDTFRTTFENNIWTPTILNGSRYLVRYDFLAPRLISAVANSLTIAFTYLLAASFLSSTFSLAIPFILLFTPRFLVMGQLMPYESLSVALFTAALYLGLRRHLNWATLLIAASFWIRYNNVYLLIFWAGYLWFVHRDWRRILYLPVLTLAIGLLTWPYLWHHFPSNLISSFQEHSSRQIGFSFYFIRSLFVTTPIPILLLAGLGFFSVPKYIRWWFISSLVFFTIFSVTGGGTRYIFVIYPALALMAAAGWKYVWGLLRYPLIQIFGAAAILGWLAFSLFSYYPYYLDYYNELVGGISGAAQSGYDVSWWGEGQREAALWLKTNAPPDSSLALYVTPKYVFPVYFGRQFKIFPFDSGIQEADYLVVSRDQYPLLAAEISESYHPVYDVRVRGVSLLSIFARK